MSKCVYFIVVTLHGVPDVCVCVCVCAVARNHVVSHGSWALLWAKRLVNWDSHLKRSDCRGDVLSMLVSYRGAEWLRSQRSHFVSSNSEPWAASRNSIFAGRTGTRVVHTRPQARFHDGFEIARALLGQHHAQLNSNNALSLYCVFDRAMSVIRGFADV